MIVTKDRVISLEYTLTDKENQLIDDTSDSGPLVYIHGHNNIIPTLERTLEGKVQGDHFHVSIPAADAYGIWEAQMVVQTPRKDIETEGDIELGMQFEAQTSLGFRVLTVTEVAGDMITLDANHPLAGKDLTFDGTIGEIREPTPEELAHGHIHSPFGCPCCDENDDCETCEGCMGEPDDE